MTNSDEYQNNTPFPHIVLDNFLDPSVLEKVLEEWPNDDEFSLKVCDTSVKYHLSESFKYGPNTKDLFDVLNSGVFLRQLEELTGIDNLIADPGLEGGGLHMIPQGGFLKMHADFNWHYSLNLMRKLNLLIYLNEDWNADWGGHLELMGPPDTMDTRVVVEPKFNRAVIFNTTSDSWHGHPYPLNTPDGVARKSLALYYYREEPPPEQRHSTLYRTDLETVEFKNNFYV